MCEKAENIEKNTARNGLFGQIICHNQYKISCSDKKKASPKKLKVSQLSEKLKATIFWARGIICIDHKKSNVFIPVEYYNLVLEHFQESIKEIQIGKLLKGVTMHLHIRVQLFRLPCIRWISKFHPAYTPNLALKDFYLFSKIRENCRQGNFFLKLI